MVTLRQSGPLYPVLSDTGVTALREKLSEKLYKAFSENFLAQPFGLSIFLKKKLKTILFDFLFN